MGWTVPHYESSPLRSVLRPFGLQTKWFQVLSNTFSPCLFEPASTLCTHHLKISAGGHSVIAASTLNMSKPPQSSLSHESVTASTFKRLFKSSLDILLLRLVPHIHLTIMRSVRSSRCISSAFTGQVSLPYTRTLCTQALYTFPFIWFNVKV